MRQRIAAVAVAAALAVGCAGCEYGTGASDGTGGGNGAAATSTATSTGDLKQQVTNSYNDLVNQGVNALTIIDDIINQFPDAVGAVLAILAALMG